jgi:glycopeptide antibiotics resistance protein
MRALSRALFAAYILILVWLVLFKFSYDPLTVIQNSQIRKLNLVPFAWARESEMIANIVAFIPFGVMLGVNFKPLTVKQKIAAIFAFSLALEAIQYALAIGVSDITDLIMNTLGGLVGLTAYGAVARHADDKYLDRSVLVAGTMILIAILYLRIFVFIVKY